MRVSRKNGNFDKVIEDIKYPVAGFASLPFILKAAKFWLKNDRCSTATLTGRAPGVHMIS